MAGKKRKGGGGGRYFLLLLFVVALVGGGAYYWSTHLDKPERPKKVVFKPPVIKLLPEPAKVTLFVPVVVGGRFYLEPRTRTTDAQGDILNTAVKMLLSTSGEKGEIGKLIPRDTKLLSPVKVRDAVATVNLSREFVDNFSGGSTQEALTLNALAYTIVSNAGGKKVDRVRILVEGEPAETLGGHFEITEPISPDAALLKPGKSS
jgi:germination protein M